MTAVMSGSGYDPEYGRKLVLELTRVGLDDVSADGRVCVYRGGTRATAMLRLSIESLRAALIASSDLKTHDVDRALGTLDDPDTTFMRPHDDRGAWPAARQ
jgi:hypothetical protein